MLYASAPGLKSSAELCRAAMQDLAGLQAIKTILEERFSHEYLDGVLIINSYLPAREIEESFRVLR